MIALGVLARSARFFNNEDFEIWDDSLEDFAPGFIGRLYPFDRFKTIYHRPTRRETLGVDVGTQIPGTKVIRHVASQEVFMVGETLRFDSDGNRLYDSAYSLHRPLGMFTLLRPETLGTGDNLGPLIDVNLGPLHADLELRTSEREQDAYEEFKGRFFLTAPDSKQIQKGDFLIFGQKSYRVEVQYLDGGYQLARVDEVSNKRENLTYLLPIGLGASFDPSTGAYTKQPVAERVFTAIVSPVTDAEQTDRTELSDPQIKLYIGFSHIGFEPKIGHMIRRDDAEYKISAIRSDPESEQWILTCRRGA